MDIHEKFTGGNIKFIKKEGVDIYLENQLRDTSENWFYWAFCIEGASGMELNFHFTDSRIGYWGPAVSHDLENWHWLNTADGDSFTYKFADDEDRVYFAHSLLYHSTRFAKLADDLSLSTFELCKSRRGRSVPAVKFGDGNKSLILTARHHACESTGSYVLEGVLKELVTDPIDDMCVFYVPFVDYDGVVDGDQGKARIPHDHNRDYTKDASIYPETAAVKEYAAKKGCNYGFDFHSPWHKGGENDNIFIVRNSTAKLDRIERFSKILEKKITPGSMKYLSKNDHPPMAGWNRPSPNFGYTMMHRDECELAFSLETAYFGTEDDKITEEKMIEFGRCFARALKEYIERI